MKRPLVAIGILGLVFAAAVGCGGDVVHGLEMFPAPTLPDPREPYVPYRPPVVAERPKYADTYLLGQPTRFTAYERRFDELEERLEAAEVREQSLLNQIDLLRDFTYREIGKRK